MIHNYYQHWRRFNNRINHNYYRKLARFFWITSFNNSTFCSRDTLFFFRMSFSFSSSLILWQSTAVSFSFCDFRYDQLDNCCIKDYNQLPTLHIQRKMEFNLSLTTENLENSWIFAWNFFQIPNCQLRIIFNVFVMTILTRRRWCFQFFYQTIIWLPFLVEFFWNTCRLIYMNKSSNWKFHRAIIWRHDGLTSWDLLWRRTCNATILYGCLLYIRNFLGILYSRSCSGLSLSLSTPLLRLIKTIKKE